ncbi:MAG: alpha/beta hydrolase [Sphingomonadales bacterium]|nr:alpha/beta hydrolase [Sphingomonadales bacterium]
MTTRHLVDPEILPLLDFMPGISLSRDLLPQIRKDTDARFAFLGETPLQPEVKVIAGPDGPLDVYLFDPAPGTTDRPALLHIHGGGMVIGSARSMQHGPSGVASALGIPVASIDYRLAPEHPFPLPQRDCLAGLNWLFDTAPALGIDPQRIGIIGESAGGGLAAAVAQMARDLGGPKLAAQFLTYPMLDHRTGGADCPHDNPVTGEFVWTRDLNHFGWSALQGDYALDDDRIGWFSPSRAASLAGLPPAWIATGSLDLFFDEDIDYARRLVAAGVPVELHSYPGAIHGFNAIADSALARAFNRDLLGAIARMLRIAG